MANTKKEEIDIIMEEMMEELTTPKSGDKTKTFELPQSSESSSKAPDSVDAKQLQSTFFSSIFNKKEEGPKKPGLIHPSRPTEDRYYDCTHSSVGVALIFNQVKVKGESERKGSEKDANDLKAVLAEIGFVVEICTDYTTKEIHQILTVLSKQDHSDNDCLLITIMTHGKRDGKIFSSDGELYVNELYEYFIRDNCKSLIGKPKLFFIQACRGSMTDPGILYKQVPKPLSRRVHADQTDSKMDADHYVIPSLADLLIMYSTAEGYYSFRNPKDGSWFIQALCDELRENPHEELMTILTSVNRRVAYAKQSFVPNNADWDASKQMPVIQSMLTKSLYFLRKEQKLRMKETIV